ncbi:MAG: ABC transporter permease [Gammaproteobacteria bacterium]|nr:ABC transporter permease [Gammaproteobacteria bacterium]
MGALPDNLHHALRRLLRTPGFLVTVVATLALGIGATTAMFSVVNGIVIKPLPYPEADRVMTVTHSAVMGNVRGNNFAFSQQMFDVYQADNRTFEALGIWRFASMTVTGIERPEVATVLQATEGTLRVLGVQPALGRWFSVADDQPGAAETAILTHRYWQRRFGSDPGVIGRTVQLNGRPHQVIGVMPAGFTLFGAALDAIVPARIDFAQPAADWRYSAIGRLRPGVTVDQANADIGRMLPVFLERHGRGRMDELHLEPAVRPLKQDAIGDIGTVLWVLLGGIGLVLFIACANVANLLLVRAEGRGQELAVRTALGADWRHLAHGLLAESLTLGALGGVLGVLLAVGGLRLLVAFGPASLPRLHELSIDAPALLVALALALGSGLLFGLAPLAKRSGRRDGTLLATFIHGGGRGASASRDQQRSQSLLVVVQVALALVLLVCSGLLIRTFQNLRAVDPGFTDPETIQTVRPALPPAVTADPDRLVQLQRQLLEQLTAIPGVTGAAYIDALPMDRGANVIVAAEDKTYAAGELPPARGIKMISPSVFRVLGTRIIAGRDFDWSEITDERYVALVSATFARETWNTIEGALGKRIKPGTTGGWHEVVGIVADIRDNGADQPAPALVYFPARQHEMIGPATPSSVAFLLRSDRTGSESFQNDIRQAIAAVDPDLPIASFNTVAAMYAISLARTTFALVLLGIAGAMALALSIVGVYGVLAHAVLQRHREVGIRLALGAAPPLVGWLFVRRGLALGAIGIAAGTLAAAAMTRFLASLLFGVTPIDAATFTAAAGFLTLAVLCASYLPAHRATRLDPLQALREE